MFSALLWLAVAASLTVYAVRLYRWASRRSGTDEAAATAEPAQAVAPAVPPPASNPPVTSTVTTPEPAPAPASRPEPAPVRTSPTATAGPRSRPPVADALAGVAMPRDLSPIVQDDSYLDPFRVSFVTDSASAEEVSAAVAGELVRLGFAVQPIPPNGLEASRDGATLEATILGSDDQSAIAGYPTVRAGSVVVEFRT